jgi:hypothetical protein
VAARDAPQAKPVALELQERVVTLNAAEHLSHAVQHSRAKLIVRRMRAGVDFKSVGLRGSVKKVRRHVNFPVGRRRLSSRFTPTSRDVPRGLETVSAAEAQFAMAARLKGVEPAA